MDHIQEAGRAGRNGKKADDITIYYDQELVPCEKGIKDYAKTNGCPKKAIFMSFDPEVKLFASMHECCSNCECDCKCSE